MTHITVRLMLRKDIAEKQLTSHREITRLACSKSLQSHLFQTLIHRAYKCYKHFFIFLLFLTVRDENRSHTDGYYRYHICFYISGRIRIRIQIISIMLDTIV